MKDPTIYDKCPTYSSARFLLRLVELGDAEDLLRCYADASSVGLMNADNCTSDFRYGTLSEMEDCLRSWLAAYARGNSIRFSVVDIRSEKAVGTIEMFDKTKTTGVLRLDLCSAYEKEDFLRELLELSVRSFHTAFGVQHILTKALPAAAERISALRACGFVPAEHHAMEPHVDYYLHEAG